MVEANYDRIGWLGEQVGAAAAGLDLARAGVADPALAGSAFGTRADAERCADAYAAVATDAVEAVSRLVSVMRADVDRFAATVSAFEAGDADSADDILNAPKDRLNIFTTHLEAGGRGSEDIRTEQADVFREAVAGSTGPTVATLDANASRGGHGADANALDAFEDDLGYTDAGDVGDTSGERRIDYVFTSPDLAVDPDAPERVEARDTELSDHDGIVVAIPLPRW